MFAQPVRALADRAVRNETLLASNMLCEQADLLPQTNGATPSQTWAESTRAANADPRDASMPPLPQIMSIVDIDALCSGCFVVKNADYGSGGFRSPLAHCHLKRPPCSRLSSASAPPASQSCAARCRYEDGRAAGHQAAPLHLRLMHRHLHPSRRRSRRGPRDAPNARREARGGLSVRDAGGQRLPQPALTHRLARW